MSLDELLAWFERLDGGWPDEFRAWAYTNFAGMDFDVLEDGALLVAYGSDGRLRGIALKRRSHRELLKRLRGDMERLRARAGQLR